MSSKDMTISYCFTTDYICRIIITMRQIYIKSNSFKIIIPENVTVAAGVIFAALSCCLLFKSFQMWFFVF